MPTRRTSRIWGRAIETMPLEILLDIFKRLSFSDRVRVSLVSRAVRAIITNFPELWIDLRRKIPHSSLPELLARSSSRLVAIVVLCGHQDNLDLLCDTLRQHMPRIRDLRISFDSGSQWNDSLTQLLQLATPKLQHLHLESTRAELSLNFPLFGGQSPMLSNVLLQGLVVSNFQPAFKSVHRFSSFDLGSEEAAIATSATETMFPSIRELKLSTLHDLLRFLRPEQTRQLTALHITNGDSAPFDTAAGFSEYFPNLTALLLVCALEPLVSGIMERIDDARLLLLDTQRGAHWRIVTERSKIYSFSSCMRTTLPDARLVLSGLTEIVLGHYALMNRGFHPAQIAEMFALAPNVRVLGVVRSHPSVYRRENDVFCVDNWDGAVLALPNLRELRISTHAGSTGAVLVATCDIMQFFDEVLDLRGAQLEILSLWNVELFGERDVVERLTTQVGAIASYDAPHSSDLDNLLPTVTRYVWKWREEDDLDPATGEEGGLAKWD